MISIFLLVVLFFSSDGRPSIGVEAFQTKSACEANIESTTKFLLENKINKASVSCQEYKLGDIS